MENNLYNIEDINHENMGTWNSLINNSLQYTPFMRDDFLDVLGYESKKYIVRRKNSLHAGICIPIRKSDGEATNAVPYAPYQGLLYTHSEKTYTNYHNNLEATEILLDYLFEKKEMKKVAFANSYNVTDVRAVQWHHYHQRDLGMYEIGMRYTSILNLERWEKDIISKNRKRDYNDSIAKYGIQICKSDDFSEFIRLYTETFARQEVFLPDSELEMVGNLIDLVLREGIGELWYALEPCGKCIDATVFIYTEDTGYYLFGANDPQYRKYGGSTKLFVDQLETMSHNGIKQFDFIGINSPQRGDFKLSFGGTAVPYYICEINY